MCWYSKEKPELKIAEKDIQVQKVLNCRIPTKIYSPVYKNEWKKNTLYRTSLDQPNMVFIGEDISFEINFGFHSASFITSYMGTWFSVITYNGIRESNELFFKEKGDFIFSAIIPKGSKYYVNKYKEYVSDQLIII